MDDGFCTGRSFAVVTAGLQSDIDSGSRSLPVQSSQGLPLGVKTAITFVIATSHDTAFSIHNDGSHHGIWAYPAGSLLGQSQGQGHEPLISGKISHLFLLGTKLGTAYLKWGGILK
jgi:hypothetical protein